MNSGPIVPSKDALELLNAHFSNSYMVPNLREITLPCADPNTIGLMLPLVVSPVLTNFELGINFILHIYDAPQIVALEALAPAYNSLVEIIFCDPMAHNTRIIDAASTLLLKCNPDKLRNFKVQTALSEEAFLHAVQLPNLEGFSTTMDATEPRAPLPTSMFPSLESLDIRATDARPPLLRTIAHIQSKTFSRLRLEFPPTPLGNFLPKVLGHLRWRGFHRTLSTLTINPDGRFELDKAFVRPLLLLKELSALNIVFMCTPPCPYMLTDEDLDELVKALPNLRSLKFGTSPCSGPANNTIKTLISIAKYCKHLTELVIHTNVEAIVNDVSRHENWRDDLALQDPFFFLAGCPVRIIIFGLCSIPDEQGARTFAMVLLRLFPHLNAITTARLFWDQLLWSMVDDIITTHRGVGTAIADVGKFMTSFPTCEAYFHVAAGEMGN